MKILIFDCDGVAWSSFHALPPLTHEEHGTAVIYGFMNYVFEIQQFEKADRLVFIWDTPESKRKEIFPEYKEKRNKKKTELTDEEKVLHKDRIRQFKLLRRKILPALGFNNTFWESGYEGDDLIATIAQDYSKEHFVKIVSRDQDLYQLINRQCVMYDFEKRKRMNEELFYDKYGIYPDMWAEVKSLAGCTTDEVPGIPGIAENRAIKYLTGNMKHTSVYFKRINSSEEIINLTKRLVVLPFEGTPHYTLQEDSCTVENLKNVARRFGLKSYLTNKRIAQFKECFCNDTPESVATTKRRRMGAAY